jgi:hypothetical protein
MSLDIRGVTRHAKTHKDHVCKKCDSLLLGSGEDQKFLGPKKINTYWGTIKIIRANRGRNHDSSGLSREFLR